MPRLLIVAVQLLAKDHEAVVPGGATPSRRPACGAQGPPVLRPWVVEQQVVELPGATDATEDVKALGHGAPGPQVAVARRCQGPARMELRPTVRLPEGFTRVLDRAR